MQTWTSGELERVCRRCLGTTAPSGVAKAVNRDEGVNNPICCPAPFKVSGSFFLAALYGTRLRNQSGRRTLDTGRALLSAHTLLSRRFLSDKQGDKLRDDARQRHLWHPTICRTQAVERRHAT